MTVDRWAEVARVCQAALERGPEARPAFLTDACAGDTDLQREVESLLAEHDRAAGLLDTPPWQLVAPALAAGGDAGVDSPAAASGLAPPVFVPGTHLGPFEILALLGAGGMGQVYKARDTRLGRTVALKVLPVAMTADPERRRRFEQEARAVSALTHPHICVLHDIGSDVPSNGVGGGEADRGTASSGPVPFLVMEYLDGQTLAQRLRKGALPLDQVLELGSQIADALSAAHKRGIIHRDLKPANIMLTKAGAVRQGSPQAKLLDFGLAKWRTQPVGTVGGSSALSTQEPATSPGRVMGTVPYMAPEQLEGKETDARTDLFAFGCVLYEMLSGRRAFGGDSEASVISAIMAGEPAPLSTLQPLTPPALDRLVRQCLAKLPDDRPDTAHDLANDLRGVRETSGCGAPTSVHPRRWGLLTALVVAGLVTAAAWLGASVMEWRRPAAAPLRVTRVTLAVDPAEEVNAGAFNWSSAGGNRTALTWTPDGQALVFVGRRNGAQQLYVRRLDAAEARPLAGTENATVPAVSPDGQWVAFWANHALKKVPLAGGPAVQLSDLTDCPVGLTWDARGTLYFGGSGIWKLPAGGAPAPVTALGETELRHVLPSVLPGGQVLLYTVARHSFTSGDEEIVAQSLVTGQRTAVLHNATDARYFPTGHLVFMRDGVLLAVPFDPGTLKVHGDAVPLIEGVAQATGGGMNTDNSTAGQFAVSSTGSLAWLAGSLPSPQVRALVAVDRHGHVVPLNAPVKSYGTRVRLSPDGRQLVVNVTGTHDVSLWTYDLERGTLTPVLQGGEAYCPIWTPDGQYLTFAWVDQGRQSVAWRRVDGTKPPEVLLPKYYLPTSWTPDGRRLAIYMADSVAIMTRERGRATVAPLPNAPKDSYEAEFSPDGHWLVYSSDDSGQSEVFVEPYPGPGPQSRVSVAGGFSPAWRRDGRAVFFVHDCDSAGQKRCMMELDFQPGTPPRLGVPRQLFEFGWADFVFSTVGTRGYDVTSDGQRFFVLQRQPAPPNPRATQINLVLNWVEELKAKVPVK
jgi:eukaryotic-like serine/threonine-protein kinase